ncbi:hypothetical protein GCM10011581_45290 [Saccharopolyspora subtropica]|uniref:Uncharacterized protein n=1 Tax=Saccharopolyspora thermophila TaxID=89367 RepID=A0A917NJT2_9PSEU|nr:hypothetical protein [Saccharopolyspora subtropica]GGJ03108.1 hypothetical protein GCM10011581_45290 [Saccharopolyspora subtropica]
MSALPQLRRLRGPSVSPAVPLAKHTVGNALVVHPPQQISDEARALAMSVVPDTVHDLVVVDLPTGLPISAWDAVADMLRRNRRGIRLVIGGRSREATALVGQWLSERIGRPVVAPDGVVFRGTGGTLFVHSGRGSGWVRFRPGRAPEWEAKRFPRPSWDSGAVDAWPTSSVGIAEPIPGGVWIHSVTRHAELRKHWGRLASGMPCQPDVFTVVLGCPGEPPLALDDVARFWHRLSGHDRERVRFVQYGPVRLPDGDVLGQALADLLDERIITYTGMPVGSPEAPDVYTMCADGELGWQSFVRAVAYLPKTHPAHRETPALVSHRAPVEGVEQISPAVYWYTPDAVIEVVQAGLWLRPPQDAQNEAAVRARTWDPNTSFLVFDAADDKRASRMRLLAQDVLARLDPATRVRCRLVPAAEFGQEVVRVAGPALGELTTEPEHVHTAGMAAEPAAAEAVPGPAAVAAPNEVAAPKDVKTPVLESPAPVDEVSDTEQTVRIGPPIDVEPPAGTAAGAPSVAAPPETPDETPASAMSIRLESSPVPVTGDAPQTAPRDEEPAPEPDPAAEPDPAGAESRTAAPASSRRDEQPAARVQPTPAPEASALLPVEGLAEERTWLRRTLNREFDAMSVSVSRILSEHPGFQSRDRSSSDVLTDAVAVRLYLPSHGVEIDRALRTGANGPHVPMARCVVSGLRKLPSHRGATVFSASPTPEQWQLYRERRLVTEWGFLHALTEPGPQEDGAVDVLVWSMTGRRTKLLEPDGADRVDNRVVFVPGTSFKILELAEPGESERGRIMLRELAESEVDAEGRVVVNQALDDLALTSLRRCMERWAGARPGSAVGEAARSRFGFLPGLV